ncbi:MAG: hypothetical protein AAGF97_04670 [Planctomycetota bacterium]
MRWRICCDLSERLNANTAGDSQNHLLGRPKRSNATAFSEPIRGVLPKGVWLTNASRGGFGEVNSDINVLALVKGDERYVFLYDDNNRAETLRTLGRYASNPELSFTWYDAAVLSQKVRQAAAADAAAQDSLPRFEIPEGLDF